jgi:hypothetical protein
MNTIDMFYPDQRVRYIPGHASGDIRHQDCEDGTVSSVGAVSVFVKFDKQVTKLGFKGTTSQSCAPEDLHIL